MSQQLQSFIDKWRGRTGSERGNLQTFLNEFCAVLGLPMPEPTEVGASYCFEKSVSTINEQGQAVAERIDLYRRECFILEGKQTSEKVRGSKKSKSSGHRPLFEQEGQPAETYHAPTAYDEALNKAFGQVHGYAQAMALNGERTPFLIVCDVGVGFHVWSAFEGGYGRYASRRVIPLDDLAKPDVQKFFRNIWIDPQSLNPESQRAIATREIAEKLGGLAKQLRDYGREARNEAQQRAWQESIARFLMRCVFTFFAEDMKILPEDLFLQGLQLWEKNHTRFQTDLMRLWQTMDSGGSWGFHAILHFNGKLFTEAEVPSLSQQQISLLRMASELDWREIEPSIFGTLLESALEPDERHRLGAHYTPRAYIQRLVDATFGTEWWERWAKLHDAAIVLLANDPSPEDCAVMKTKLNAFRAELGSLKVLDPACGSGNFLYVAYDTLKRIEKEVLATLEEFGETRMALSIQGEVISPAQFHGLELNHWAASIAELVLWIAHLQWFRTLYPGAQIPEPVLQNYDSIQQRDAVLAWSGTRDTGRTRWGGRTLKHKLTGKDVPDPTDQLPIFEYLEPHAAQWPQADYIVGNPPFLGNAQLREALGDGYAEALRAAYPEVPDTVDLVLYWWHKAALEVREGRAKRFGLITTNSLRQVRQRSVIANHCTPSLTGHNRPSPANKETAASDGQRWPVMKSENLAPLRLLWVVPDHPWSSEGAAVRIAMSVAGLEGKPWLGRVVSESHKETPEAEAEAVMLEGRLVDEIHVDLSAGASVAEAVALKANEGLCSRGMQIIGAGFIVSPRQYEDWGRPSVVHPYRNGRDFTDRPRDVLVIDLFGLEESEVRRRFPQVYQHVLEHVKPERDQNNRATYRDNWWIFGEARANLRPALVGLQRYIATVETAKHRIFQFLDGMIVPDNMLIVIASNDAFCLGVLASSIHLAWVHANAGTLGAYLGNVRYHKSRCFDPFPFPEASEAQKAAIRELAEELDAHRKAAQGRGVTITQMYNLLEKLKAGDTLTEAERKQHEKALTSLLLDLHQRLDGLVLAAYDWPAGISDEEMLEHLVALNRERAAEEATGTIRWLRPDYQAPR